MHAILDSTRPFEQFVLLSVVELATADRTPAHSYDVTKTAKARLDDVDRDTFGGVERQAVIATLGSLAEDGLLAKAETRSPTGKGRPAYELAVDAESVIANLSGDDVVGPYADSLSA